MMAYRGGGNSSTFLVNATAGATATATIAGQADKQHFLKGALVKCDTAGQAITITANGTAMPTIRVGNEDVVLDFGDGIPGGVGGAISVAVATGTAVDVTIWGETLPGAAALVTS